MICICKRYKEFWLVWEFYNNLRFSLVFYDYIILEIIIKMLMVLGNFLVNKYNNLNLRFFYKCI